MRFDIRLDILTLLGYSAVGQCRDNYSLARPGTAGILFSLRTAGIFCGWALQRHPAVGYSAEVRAEGEDNIRL